MTIFGHFLASSATVGMDDMERESEQEAFNPTRCLFCPDISESLETNISHMHKIHGLFIPDQEYLVDLESLINYLHIIVNDFHECLYCGKDLSQGGREAVRMHMIAKGHCNINLDGTSELEDFYDFGDDDGKGEDGGDDDDDDMGDGEEREKDSRKGKAKQVENEDSKHLTPENDGTIHLPSGKTLSNRSHSHHYRPKPTSRNYHNTPNAHLIQQRLALEKLKSASSNTTSDLGEAETLGEKTEGGDNKEKISMAIEKLATERVRGVNRGQVVRRRGDEMALSGLSEVERRAVVLAERKMIKTEMRARNGMRWKSERMENQQGRFKPDAPGPKLG